MATLTKLSAYARNTGAPALTAAKSEPAGTFMSSTMMVMMIATTPSVNASSLCLLIALLFPVARPALETLHAYRCPPIDQEQQRSYTNRLNELVTIPYKQTT